MVDDTDTPIENHRWAMMSRAIELAHRGEGHVEPNPMVGCVVVQEEVIVGEGWHREYGGPHAEIAALRAAGAKSVGATMYVSLEPCCHQGKTSACTLAILQAKISKVVVGCLDPNPLVSGQGVSELKSAGIEVDLIDGVLREQAQGCIAPFAKLITKGIPWVIAKWAMTLDGKLATQKGDSQWISNLQSRKVVHQLRGRVDAILVGRGTLQQDDPQLTARPEGARKATRVIVDSHASLSLQSRLATTAKEVPVLLAVGANASTDRCLKLRQMGVEVVSLPASKDSNSGQEVSLEKLLETLGNRKMTNLLVEGGGEIFGSLQMLDAIDEVHAFIAPKLIGGKAAVTPMGGAGLAQMNDARELGSLEIRQLEQDIYVQGRRLR